MSVRFSIIGVSAAIALISALFGLVTCSGGSGSMESGGGSPLPGTATVDVTTYHNDNARTGQNLRETVLTHTNVSSATFGKLAFYSVDGKVDAQPLVLSLAVGGETHSVVVIATEHDSVYAFDVNSGSKLWQVSLLGTGETTSDDRSCSQVVPEIGVTSTPVIDRNAGAHGTIWLVAMSTDGAGHYFQRLHALDVTTGAELSGSPRTIAAQYPGSGPHSSGGNVVFDPGQYEERAALLLVNGTIYTTWTSHCDIDPYTGWVISYDAATLMQSAALNTTPNGSEGSYWSAGAGPAADANGIYLMSANGTFDTTLDVNGFPSGQDYGNAFLRLDTSGGGLRVADYFTMSNTVALSAADQDLGSGGPLLFDVADNAGTTHHLVAGAGKNGVIYVLDRSNLGKFDANGDHSYQQVTLSSAEFGMPAWFNGTLYFGMVSDVIRAFKLVNGKLATPPASTSATTFPYPGTTPSISANGTAEAILWAAENGNTAVLHAYDANDLSNELYNSNQAAGGRDHFGAGNKFITPTIANGRVFIGTQNGVAVFGRLAP